MDDDTEQNTSSPSTTHRWKWVRIRVPAEGPKGSRPKAVRPSLSSLNRREKLTITVSRRGGAEDWWQLEARGRIWRRPGVVALADVLDEIYEGNTGRERSAG